MYKTPELKIGSKYLISFTEEANPGYSPECYYEGIAVYLGPATSAYPDDVLEFDCLEENDHGYFGITDVVQEIDKNDIVVIDSNDDGSLALAYKDQYGVIFQTVFIPCKNKDIAKQTFDLLNLD